MAEAPRPRDLVANILPVIEARHREAWLVGGWVRDWLLGRVTHDIDFVVPGGAVATARKVADVVSGSFVLLDDARDTARVVVGPPEAATFLDFAGLRASSIEADLLARDFTVNAMATPAAASLSSEPQVIDPAGGRRDLAEGLLRAVSPDSFREDPLRMLRGVRLGASLGFMLESQTAAWIQRDAELLDTVSRERVRDELAQMLVLPRAERSLRQLDGLRLLDQVLPELAPLRQVEARFAGEVSALNHSLRTVGVLQAIAEWIGGAAWSLTPAAGEAMANHMAAYRAQLAEYLAGVLPGGRSKLTTLMLAALLHEAGKGATEQGRAAASGRLLGHEVLGASLAATIARRLCFSSAETVRVRLTVRNYLRPAQLLREPEVEPSRRAIYRFFRDAEPSGVEAMLLSLADDLTRHEGGLDRDRWQRLVAVSAALLDACFVHRQEIIDPPPIVDGHGLIEALDLVPGPEVGVLLDGIREAQAAGELHSRDDALALAKRMLEREGLR